jgi:thiamine biosynthesis lipoprotein
MQRRIILCFALTLVVIGARPALAQPVQPARFEFSRIIMGSQARIVLYAADEPQATSAAAAAFDRLNHLDAVMSDYREDSELMRLCAKAGQGPIPVSDDLLTVLVKSATMADRSGGAFDPTVGPVVALWRQARRDQALPASDDLTDARRLVDHAAVHIDEDAGTIELAIPGMRLDLGGIGKGFAADETIKTLAGAGITSCLVDLGGDIALADPPPGKGAWSITVELADGSTRSLRLANASIATSGDAEQFVEIDGVRYSHIVDPHTGLGLTNRAAATVIAPSGADADALASAACVLGPVEGIELIESIPGVECLVSTSRDGAPATSSSTGFPR